MPVAFFTRTRTGALVSRLNNDVIGAQTALTSTLSGVLTNAIQLVLTLAVMLTLSWQVTVLALVLLPIFVIPARGMGARMAELRREASTHNAAMTTQMTERFSAPGATLVKLFGWAVAHGYLDASPAANLPTILYSLFWRRFNTRGALWSIYGGLTVTIVLIIFSPAVSGGPKPMIKGVDFHWFPLENPGLVSIPAGFLLGWLGTILSKEHNPEKYAEMEVRSLTGAGAEKAIHH